MNTKGHIITDDQFKEYKELKELIDDKKKFRIEFYDIMGSIRSLDGNMQSFYVPSPSKDYLEIDCLNTNETSQAVINMLEEWFKQYEEKHKVTLEEIDKKIKYLHENDKDMRIPKQRAKTQSGEMIDTFDHKAWRNVNFLDYLKGLVKFKR